MGSKATKKKHLQRLRKKLRTLGMDEVEIEAIVASRKRRYEHDRERSEAAARQQARNEAETYARWGLDDSKHKPTAPDPLTRGVGRVSGATAKAVKRGRTLTLHEYREQTLAPPPSSSIVSPDPGDPE